MRRTVGLSHHAPAGGPATPSRRSTRRAPALPRNARAGGRPWCRHRVVRRRVTAGKRRAAGHGALQQHPAHRPGRPHRTGPARRTQPRYFPGSSPLRPVLRARPFLTDRLFHRRQCRRKRWRRALPEVRPDRAQPAQGRHPDRGRRTPDIGLRRPRFTRLRPAGTVHRFRRHARGDHRSHRQTAAQTAVRQGAAGGVRLRRESWASGR
ncbi:hypothetical protein D3C84_653320 [compost metagenome]